MIKKNRYVGSKRENNTNVRQKKIQAFVHVEDSGLTFSKTGWVESKADLIT